jgi:hypothetical protein
MQLPIARAPGGLLENVTVCISTRAPKALAVGGEPGVQPLATVDGAPQGGRLAIAYVGRRTSLADLAGDIAERYGRGNAAWLGSWTWLVIGALLLGALVAAGATLRSAAGAAPSAARVARLAAGTALLTGSTWALVTPPVHVPDEVSHRSRSPGRNAACSPRCASSP